MITNIISNDTIQELIKFINNSNRFDLVQEMIISSQKYNTSFSMGHFTSSKNFMDFKSTIKTSEKKQTFGQFLQSLVIEKGFENNEEFYTKTKQSRSYYHKIVSGKIKKPGKDKLIHYALALKLNNSELDTLLQKAGHSLKDTPKDMAIHWFFDKKIYDDATIHKYMIAAEIQSIFN